MDSAAQPAMHILTLRKGAQPISKLNIYTSCIDWIPDGIWIDLGTKRPRILRSTSNRFKTYSDLIPNLGLSIDIALRI
jgi:hypothetical protein